MLDYWNGKNYLIKDKRRFMFILDEPFPGSRVCFWLKELKTTILKIVSIFQPRR